MKRLARKWDIRKDEDSKMRKNAIAVAAGLAMGALVLAVFGCKKSEPAAGGAPSAAPSSSAAGKPASVEPTAVPAGLDRHSLDVDGQIVEIAHSPLDMGRMQDLFDDSPATLARTAGANPAILELTFSKPRTLEGIDLTTATQNIDLKCVVTLAGGGEKTFRQEYRKLSADPTVHLDFPGLGGPVQKLRIEIGNPNGGDGHIHMRTLRLL